jgi:hypothetical protein
MTELGDRKWAFLQWFLELNVANPLPKSKKIVISRKITSLLFFLPLSYVSVPNW